MSDAPTNVCGRTDCRSSRIRQVTTTLPRQPRSSPGQLSLTFFPTAATQPHLCPLEDTVREQMSDDDGLLQSAIDLVARLERAEQNAPGSDTHNGLLVEYGRLSRCYPITLARAVDRVIGLGPRHWNAAVRSLTKPF